MVVSAERSWLYFTQALSECTRVFKLIMIRQSRTDKCVRLDRFNTNDFIMFIQRMVPNIF